MRHKNKTKYLGRTASHRDAMLSNMATSLIMHKRIFTTVPKAKALRRYVEPIITRSKEDTTNSRRIVFSMLQNKYAVTELFQSVSPKVSDRPGGYTRIIKTGFRLGDNAPMCFIELVDFNENMLSDDKAKKGRTRRSRRRSGGGATVAAETTRAATEVSREAVEEVKADEVKVEEAKKSEGVAAEVETPESEAAPVEEVTEVPAEEAPVAEETPAASDETKAEEPKEDKKEDSPEKES